MLLQALVEHYERLIKNGRIPKSGFSSVGVSFVIKINKKGELINVISCKDREKKRMIPRMMTLPERVERSGKKINANFLCDNSKYMFGFGKDGVTEEYQKCFEAFKILHLKILKEVNCCEAKALLTFLENWMPQNEKDNSVLKVCIKDILAGGNLVFSVEDFSGYIHENEQIQNAWHRYKKNQKVGEKSQCLVTGEKDVIARVHPSIKSIQGGQSRGSKLVSFNASAYESYGKKGLQGLNAPVGEYATFAYTTVLNTLLADKNHFMYLGNTTIVFWSNSKGKKCEDIVSLVLDTSELEKETESKPERNEEAVKFVKEVFENLKQGKPSILPKEDADADIYILGLSPNAARVSVRFFRVDKFGTFFDNVMKHYVDLKIEKEYESEKTVIPIWRILRETISKHSTEKVSSPLLTAPVMNAILNGTKYPEALYNNILLRCKAEQNINYYKAAVIKACLIRKARFRKEEKTEEELTVGLNNDTTKKAYVLGRLFAVLEKAQVDASSGTLSTTIKDRYFTSASTRPGSVFPRLLQLSNYHTAKSDYGVVREKEKQEILDKLDVDNEPFPKVMTTEDQGYFVLGYYQQRKDLYAKKEN